VWSFTTYLFLALLVTSVSIAKINARRGSGQIEKFVAESVVVAISGAVQKPGRVRLRKGEPLSAALRKARLKPYANLRDVDQTSKVNESLCLHIDLLDAIRVECSGALREDVTVVVPVRTRLCQLKSKLPLSTDADASMFKSKRLLKDGEKIVVPYIPLPTKAHPKGLN
jgi:hypothetical protein